MPQKASQVRARSLGWMESQDLMPHVLGTAFAPVVWTETKGLAEKRLPEGKLEEPKAARS